MKNILNSPSITKAQKRLNSTLDKLEAVLSTQNNIDNDAHEKLQLELETIEQEFEIHEDENKKLKTEIKKQVSKAIKQLEEVLNGNS